MTQAAHKPTPAARTAAHSDKAAGQGRRTQVRDSGIHGKGVYAVRPIQAGERVLEYKGEIITWEEALERHPHDPEQPNHTFTSTSTTATSSTASTKATRPSGSTTACEPNLEAEQVGNRVFLDALRDIAPGEELFFDYGLVIDARMTPKLKKEYACWCGAPTCRGTMLAPKERKRRSGRR